MPAMQALGKELGISMENGIAGVANGVMGVETCRGLITTNLASAGSRCARRRRSDELTIRPSLDKVRPLTEVALHALSGRSDCFVCLAQYEQSSQYYMKVSAKRLLSSADLREAAFCPGS